MTLPSFVAGTYTVALSDGQYQANAVFDNGTLDEGFTDFTGGGFCNIAINGVDCPNTSGDYAFDITGFPAATVPEPAFGGTLLGTVLLGLAVIKNSYRRSDTRGFCPSLQA